MRVFILGAVSMIGMVGTSSTVEAAGLRLFQRGASCATPVACAATPMCDVVQTANPIVQWVPRTMTRTRTVIGSDGIPRQMTETVTVMVPQTALDVQLAVIEGNIAQINQSIGAVPPGETIKGNIDEVRKNLIDVIKKLDDLKPKP